MNLCSLNFFQQLSQLTCIEKIIVFGSRARNDAQPRSDIDLALVCPQASEKDWLTILGIIENADTLLKIDAIRFDTLSEKNPLKEKIKQEGIVLYAKK